MCVFLCEVGIFNQIIFDIFVVCVCESVLFHFVIIEYGLSRCFDKNIHFAVVKSNDQENRFVHKFQNGRKQPSCRCVRLYSVDAPLKRFHSYNVYVLFWAVCVFVLDVVFFCCCWKLQENKIKFTDTHKSNIQSEIYSIDFYTPESKKNE